MRITADIIDPLFEKIRGAVSKQGLQLEAAGLSRRHVLAVSLAEAAEVLGDVEKAVGWFRTPSLALGGKIPLELMTTDSGVRMVREELLRIRYGDWA